MANPVASGGDNMTDLVEKGDVCVVIVISEIGHTLFGVYESKDLAVKRVHEHADLGLIKENDIVVYNNETVWGSNVEGGVKE